MNNNNKQLETEIWKAKAQTWEQAFAMLVRGKIDPGATYPRKVFSLKELGEQEGKAINFVEEEVTKLINKSPPQQGEVGVQFSWLEPIAGAILNKIKQEAPFYIVKVLELIKEKAIPYAMQIIEWLLDKLEDYLYHKWKESCDCEEQTYLKDKIIESFPASQLANRLRSEN